MPRPGSDPRRAVRCAVRFKAILWMLSVRFIAIPAPIPRTSTLFVWPTFLIQSCRCICTPAKRSFATEGKAIFACSNFSKLCTHSEQRCGSQVHLHACKNDPPKYFFFGDFIEIHRDFRSFRKKTIIDLPKYFFILILEKNNNNKKVFSKLLHKIFFCYFSGKTNNNKWPEKVLYESCCTL